MKFHFKIILICLIVSQLMAVQSFSKVVSRIEYACYPESQKGGRMLLIVGIDGSNLNYKKHENGFQASVTFAVVVNDSTKNYFVEKQTIETPFLKDTLQFGQQYTITKEIPLTYGRFSVDIVAFENNRFPTDTFSVSFFIDMPNPATEVTTSGLLYLQPQNFDPKVSIFQQDTRAFRVSDFYLKTDTLLSFYGEVMGLATKLSSGSSLLSRVRVLDSRTRYSLDAFGRIQKVKYREGLAQKTDLDIKNLPTGKYLLVWDLVDSTFKVLARSEKYFSKSNPDLKVENQAGYQQRNSKLEELVSSLSLNDCRLTVAALLPIAKASEQATIEYLRKKGKESEVRNYLTSFWSRHNAENPAGALLAYRELLEYATKKYSTQTMPAYQTERGRVLLQYGKPNLIENEYSDRFRKAMQNLNTIPYEIWYYYNLEKPVKQNDVIFVFVMENRGNDNYRLIHSTGIGEVRNREWRKALESNATYNFDRMDPNDRYDPNDTKRFR